MRVWFTSVIAVAGCNQIFGNNAVNPVGGDANRPGLDASYAQMTVMYGVEAGPDQIGTMPMYVPFDTQVHVGPIDTKDPTNLELRPVVDGTFTVRFETVQARYRLIFTTPEGVDVELQSQLANANLVIPRAGRIDRGTVADNSKIPYAFSGGPLNTTATWHDGQAFGTGLWSKLEFGLCCAIEQVPPAKIDYRAFLPLSGPLGVPTAADMIVFTDSVSDSAGTLDADHASVYGYATMTLDGFDGTGTPINLIESAWKTPITQTALHQTTTAFGITYATRAQNLLNNEGAIELPEIKKLGGVVAAPNFFPFTEILLNQSTSVQSVSGDLDHVVFVPLAHSLLNPIRFVNPYNGVDAPSYPTALMVVGSTKRTYTNSGASVRSGIQALALQTDGAPEVNIGDGVGFASHVTIKPTSVADVAMAKDLLAGADEQLLDLNDVGTSIKTFDLVFSSDTADTTATIDDCSITLYQIGPTTLTPIKRYLTTEVPTTAVPLVIDQGLFDLVHDYAFGISCYHGHPMVKTGDWRTVTYPLAASTIYTKSFKVRVSTM